MVDTQIIELSGKHFLVSQLLAGSVEVAEPVRDRGIDLIAYVDRINGIPEFLACPIQLKANQAARFMLDRKYASVRNLLMVYVWFVSDFSLTEVYALTYEEALGLLEAQGHTNTESWIRDGVYTLSVNDAWKARLRPYRMVSKDWQGRIRGLFEPSKTTAF